MIDISVTARATRCCRWILVLSVAAFAVSTTAQSGDDGLLTEELAQATVDEIRPKVEELRGLSFKQPVPVTVIDDDAARKHMLKRLEMFDVKDQMKAAQHAYALLGLLPDGTDILESYLAALREQAGGFYDPTTRSYYLLGDMPAGLATLLTAHELTHALEDQYYDLDKRLREVMDDDDQVFARSAVHEGSATLLMGLFSVRGLLDGSVTQEQLRTVAESEEAQGAGLDELPPVLLRQLMGPYVLGAGFLVGGNLVAGMAGGFPVDRVGQAYDDGPVSSEQILHPDKYWGEPRDDPQPVELGAAGELLGRKWSRRGEGVLGELTLGVLVGAETPMDPQSMMTLGAAAWTNEAAAGWDGDRWELWSRGKASVVLLLTAWDSDEDASEFAEALPERADCAWKRSGDRVAIVAGRTDDGPALLARMLGEGDPPPAAD